MRVPLRPLRRLALQPSMSPPSICVHRSPSSFSSSSSSPSFHRPPSALNSETCAFNNLTLNLVKPLSKSGALTLILAQPARGSGCLSRRGDGTSSHALQRCYCLGGTDGFPEGYGAFQRGFCHACTDDVWTSLHKSSSATLQICLSHGRSHYGCSHLLPLQTCCHASLQKCFCHGTTDNQPNPCHEGRDNELTEISTSSLTTLDENEVQKVSQGKQEEVEEEEENRLTDAIPVLSSHGDDSRVKAEKCESKDNSTPKKSGAMRSLAERRRGLFSRHSQGRIPDLLTVPGIGPRNMEKLVAKGIGKVAELKQLYLDKFRRDGKDKMIKYLQSSVGILHKHHAMSITTFIKDSVEKEMKSEEGINSDGAAKNRLTFCVEGNISVGKTTFLHRVTNEAIELRDLVEIVPEPVAKWQDIGPEHFNILDAFYAEPQRYAYTFQNYVFITRLMQEQESAGSVKPLRIMERSVFSDRMVFVRAVHEAKWMNEMEISIYDSWFNPVVSVLPGLVPDGFIYLRASPDTCHRRLQMRKRPEEQGVTLDYLRGLHEKHEQWLFPASSNSEGIFSVTRPSQLVEPLPPTLQDRVYYLEGEHVHSSLQKVPALILDCEANIDFTRDLEAKALYAKQVSDFFEYVKRAKFAEPKAEATQDMISRGLLLPRSSGLFMPDGSMLPSQPLKSLDLKQQAPVYRK